MKTSTKVALWAIGLLVLAGLVIAAFRPVAADGDDTQNVQASNAPTPAETTSAPEPELGNTLPEWPGRRNAWKIVLDETLLIEHPNTFACTMYARDTSFDFLDVIPIRTIIEVQGDGYCSGFYEVTFRMWVSGTTDVSELEAAYDLVLRYPTELGYGYLLGQRTE